MVKLWDAEDSVLRSVTWPCWREPQISRHYRGSLVPRPRGPIDTFKNGMEVGLWEDENIGDFFLLSWWFSFTNRVIFFCLKKAFAPSLTMFMGYTASYQVRRWRPCQPTFLEFSSIVCNTRWHTQNTLYTALHALYESSFIIQAQKHSSSEVIQSLHWFHWKFVKDSRNFPQSQLADQEEVHIFEN